MTDYVKPALIMASLGVARYLDAEDPDTVFWARCTYLGSLVITWSIIGLIYWRIKSGNDETLLTVNESDVDPAAQSPLSGVFGNNDLGKSLETTNKEYDLTKLKKQMQETVIGPFIVLFLHAYMGMFPPLIVSSVVAISGALSTELAKLHVWSLVMPSITRDKTLLRPWRTKSLSAQFNEVKREVKAQLNDGKEGAGGRRSKKNENRRKVTKTQ